MTNPNLKKDVKDSYTWVIGDLEGRTDLFKDLLEKIEKNPSNLLLASNDDIVMLGNFLKDAKSPKKVLDCLSAAHTMFPNQLCILRGQTEQKIIYNRELFWKSELGKNFIKSYTYEKKPPYGYARAQNKLDVPRMLSDIEWLNLFTQPFYTNESVFICSGGVNSKLSLEDQYVNSLMYFGMEAYAKNEKIDKRVVHGQSIMKRKTPLISNARVDVCTNPSVTDTLSCVVFHNATGEVRDVITVKR